MQAFRQIAALLLALALESCVIRDNYIRAKQLRTYADMQKIVAQIEDLRSSISTPLEDSQVQPILASVAKGRDAWGNKFVFRGKPSKSSSSYVLISYGSDGQPDVSSLEDYFTLPESRIQGDGWKDIVFRDGAPVANAGK